MLLSRSDGYMGVLVDDLVGRGTAEPYRMLSARAEFRLALRPDTADLRLTDIGLQLGLVGEARAACFRQRSEQIAAAEGLLGDVRLSASAWGRHGFQVAQDGTYTTAAEMLTRPGTTLEQLAAAAAAERAAGWQTLQVLADTLAPAGSSSDAAPKSSTGGVALSSSSSSDAGDDSSSPSPPAAHGAWSASAVDTAVFNCHYRPYLKRMEAEVAELRRDEALRIPPTLDYSALQLSAEDREKLQESRPASLAAAQRIPGVTPAALIMLLQHVRKRQARGGSGGGSRGGSRGERGLAQQQAEQQAERGSHAAQEAAAEAGAPGA